jgi:hypothetical protein
VRGFFFFNPCIILFSRRRRSQARHISFMPVKTF